MWQKLKVLAVVLFLCGAFSVLLPNNDSMITFTHSDFRNVSLNLQQAFYTNLDDQPTRNYNYYVKLEGGGMMCVRLAQLV